VASNETQAIVSADRYNNLALTGSNTVFAGLLEYQQPTVNVGATYPVTAAETGTVYRMGALGSFSNITLPTLATSNTGVFWQFVNVGTSNLSVTLTGTTDITSPVTVYPGATYTIRWTGSNYVGTQDKDVPASAVTESFMVANIASNIYYSYDGGTWSRGSLSNISTFKPVWVGTRWMSATNGIYVSPDGITWATSNSGTGYSSFGTIHPPHRWSTRWTTVRTGWWDE
jgi:hypothetical protein